VRAARKASEARRVAGWRLLRRGVPSVISLGRRSYADAYRHFVGFTYGHFYGYAYRHQHYVIGLVYVFAFIVGPNIVGYSVFYGVLYVTGRNGIRSAYRAISGHVAGYLPSGRRTLRSASGGAARD
jgi:hypothetical protein